MAYILYNKGERAMIDAFLGGAGSAAAYQSPAIVPAGSGTVGDFGVGLGTRSGGVGTSKNDTISTIAEVGTSTAEDYARQPIERSQVTGGWPASTLVGGSYQTVGPQVTFGPFTGSPDPNGATMWFLAGSTTLGADNALFGADLADPLAPRNYLTGEIQRVSVVYRAS